MRYVAMFLLVACCSTPPKHVDPPYHEVVETNGKFRDDLRQRDIPIHTYAPIGAKTPFPIVIFVAGDSDSFFGRALARAGFYALHLTQTAIDNPENRVLDVTFVLDKLAEDNLLDIKRVAIAGSGAGASTALIVAQRDKRVKAIATMNRRNAATIAAFLRASVEPK